MNWKKLAKIIGVVMLSSFLVYCWLSLLDRTFLSKSNVELAVLYACGLLSGMGLWQSLFAETETKKS